MTLDQYVQGLQRSIENLIDGLQEKQATIDRMEPVFLWACKLAELWGTRFDTLPDSHQELVRLYRKAKEGESD